MDFNWQRRDEDCSWKRRVSTPNEGRGVSLAISLAFVRGAQHVPRVQIKYHTMTNCWLLAQMRLPGRPLFADFTKDTRNDVLEEWLSKDDFRMERKVHCKKCSAPTWEFLPHVRLPVDKSAFRKTKENHTSRGRTYVIFAAERV